MSQVQYAYIGHRIRALAITNVAQNIFAATGVGVTPVVPFSLHDRRVCAFKIQNNSANDWYYGTDSTVTAPGGANPGMIIPKSFSQISLQVVTGSLWVISSAGGPDVGVIEEFI